MNLLKTISHWICNSCPNGLRKTLEATSIQAILEMIGEMKRAEEGGEKAKIRDRAVVIKHGGMPLWVRAEVVTGGVVVIEKTGLYRENREVVARSTMGKGIDFKGLRHLS